jgi:flavin-dependent dehydrogenase
MIETDVAVIGAGPAGAAAALNLAPHRSVLLVERRTEASDRIGESLPAAAGRLLRDMGLWEAFLAEGHAPCYANRSVWGDVTPVEQDSLRNPDGHGWHLHRARFEQGLRAAAIARGAAFLAPAHPLSLERRDGAWELRLDVRGSTLPVRARILIDAGGRSSKLLRMFGARRTARDKLVCGWIHGLSGASPAGITYTEADAQGWWYTAPLPDGRRLLAFHTDADLPAAVAARSARSLLARASELASLRGLLEGAQFDHDAPSKFCAAHSAELAPFAGDGWFAVGDAALSFDPLSSQGLFNALYTGLAAALCADAVLSGDYSAYARYGKDLASIRDAYRAHLAAWYGEERRWRDNPFWSRRAAPLA